MTSAAVTKSGATKFRFVIMSLAFLITLVNYMDRSAISYAIDPIKKEFGLDEDQFGSILAAFGIGYMMMTLGGGIIADKWGARRVWSGAAVVWSSLTAMMGIASGVPMFCTLRVSQGLAEGPHFPALTRVVADWLPKSERALSTGIGLCAVPLASAIGAPLISNLILSFGWRLMFVILASLGVVWAVIWFLVYRDYPELSKSVNAEELAQIRDGKQSSRSASESELRKSALASGKTTWKMLLTNPSLIANNVAYFAFGYSLFFALNWLPGFLKKMYHVELKEAGYLLIMPWLLAAILLPLAGFLSDYLLKKTGSKRISRSHLICVTQLVSGLAYIPLLFSPPLPVAILVVSLGVGFGMMPNAVFYAINCDVAKDRAATSQGLMNCCSAVASIMAPKLTGYIAARTGSFTGAFAILIVFIFISVITVFLFQRLDSMESDSDG